MQISRSSQRVTAAAFLVPSSLDHLASDLASVLASGLASGRSDHQLLAITSCWTSLTSYSTFVAAWPASGDYSTNSVRSCSFAASSNSSEPSATFGPFEGSITDSSAVAGAYPSVLGSASEAYLCLASELEDSDPSIVL